jgi:hypothetical protein
MLPLLAIAALGVAYWVYTQSVNPTTGLTAQQEAAYTSLGLNVPSDALGAGPDYLTAERTQAQVSQWAKPALIAAGYWDPRTNAMTKAFYALPADKGGY